MTSQTELDRLRWQFEQVDKRDKVSLRQWLLDTAYLGTTTQAIIAGISYERLLVWRRRTGLSAPVKCNLLYYNKPTINTLVAPPNRADWNNHEWLSNVLKTHSVVQIAQAVGLSRRTMRGIIAKHGLKARPSAEVSKSKNPCCNREWLEEHLLRRKLPIARCMAIAGVGWATFFNWMAKFGIRPTNHVESCTGHNGLWVRTLHHRLKSHPAVRAIKCRPGRLRVSYHYGSVEEYWLERDPPRHRLSTIRVEAGDTLEHIPSIRPEFETLEPDPVHVTIRRGDWKRANQLERRIAMYMFLEQMRRSRWPKYPDEILRREYEAMLRYDRSRFVRAGTFTIYPKHRYEVPGRRLLEHFVDILDDHNRRFARSLCRSSFLYLAAKQIPITTHNFWRTLGMQRWLVRTPLMYAALLERLGVKGAVLDLYPFHGAKAVACAILGLKYYTWPTERLEEALANGLAEYVGLDYEPYAGQKIDLVLADCNLQQRFFHPIQVEVALEAGANAKHVLVYVPHQWKTAIQDRYQPSTAMQLRTRVHCGTLDYAMIW